MTYLFTLAVSFLGRGRSSVEAEDEADEGEDIDPRGNHLQHEVDPDKDGEVDEDGDDEEETISNMRLI